MSLGPSVSDDESAVVPVWLPCTLSASFFFFSVCLQDFLFLFLNTSTLSLLGVLFSVFILLGVFGVLNEWIGIVH